MALPAQSQEPPDVEQATKATENAKSEAAKLPSQSSASRAKRARKRERLVDEFIPSEEVSADQAVAFPADM
jgi:hypothetical protein